MSDINKVILVGRLTRDAELKYTSKGSPVSNFSIAVNEISKINNENKEIVSYFKIVLWGVVAEKLQQYLTKGKQVAIDGKLRQDRWQQEGNVRQKVKIICEKIQLLGNRSQNPQLKNCRGNDIVVDKCEDDIPF